MRIINTTDISSDLIREIVSFVRPNGIKGGFDISVKNCAGAFAGRAYHQGTSFHARSCPLVVVRIGGAKHYPRMVQYPGKKTAPRYWVGDRIEGLVMVMAHELRHLWQAKQRNRRGYVPMTRGKFSEVDAEGYALRMLRAWRRNYLSKQIK